MGTKMKAWVVLLLSLLITLSVSGSSRALETRHFLVRDLTGQLSEDRLMKLTQAAEDSLHKILEFWGVDSKVDRLGKIHLEFEKPRGMTYATVFLMVKEAGRQVRVVRIYGVSEEPQMVAHKLTHAVFPTPDKLIRNMMGIPMEVLFGNPLTFPRCGFSPDEWVAAFRHNNSYIPLTELGPDHEQWGMATRGGVPVVTNKARQHIMYAESGSFGAFLIDTFGKARVLKFYRFSAGTKRPWEEVFGASLKDLEAQWLRDLETTRKPDGKNVRHLLNLIKKDPEKACSEAQELANADSPKK